MAIAAAHDLAVVEDCAHAHGQRWNDVGAPAASGPSARSATSPRRSSPRARAGRCSPTTTGWRGSPIRSSIAAGPRTTPSGSTRSAPTTGSASCTQRCSRSLSTGSLASRRGAPSSAPSSRSQVATVPGVRVMPPRLPDHAVELLPVRGGDRPRRVRRAHARCRLRCARGRGRRARGPGTSRCRGTTCSSRRCRGCPVAVEHAARLDSARMSFPVAEAAGLREAVYVEEDVFRDGEDGVAQAVAAIAKIQRHADELRRRAASSRREEAGKEFAVRRRAASSSSGPVASESPTRDWSAAPGSALARPADRRLDREPLVGLRVLHEAEHLRGERLGRRTGGRRRDRSRQLTSTTSSSGRFGIAPSLRTFTTCTSPVPACSEATRAAAASV